MKGKTSKAQITISRPQYGDGTEKITIDIRDDDAGVTFLNLELSLEAFSRALTGLAFVECDMETGSLGKVGKVIKRDEIIVEIPKHVKFSERKEVTYRLACEAAPKGYEVVKYFGSQDSFFTEDGKNYARASVRRWIDK